ncbi:MAG: hypothetical protein A2020_05935 [Lentisphaerae bacterium GWF2_45_14]|nr:MAG: hypothetical protein A2020_05935 [Lentisphaerae bacterium GWF2_45_14]
MCDFIRPQTFGGIIVKLRVEGIDVIFKSLPWGKIWAPFHFFVPTNVSPGREGAVDRNRVKDKNRRKERVFIRIRRTPLKCEN